MKTTADRIQITVTDHTGALIAFHSVYPAERVKKIMARYADKGFKIDLKPCATTKENN